MHFGFPSDRCSQDTSSLRTSPSDLMLLFLRFSVGEDRACCSASSASLVLRSRGFGVSWFLCELCVGSCVDSGSPAT